MHKLSFILAIMIMLSGCIVPPRSGKWECLSGTKTEYLVPSSSEITYSKQWTYGNWKPISIVGDLEASRQLQTCKINDRQVKRTAGSWIYACDPKFSWDNPPIFKSDIQKPAPGSNIPPEPPNAIYPSIYRHFFNADEISSGTLYVSVVGSVDVYMDPPVGTALINNPKTMSKCYLGRSNSLNQVTISLDKVYPGTHCLYFVHRANNNITFFGLKYNLELAETVSQTSDCLWPITAGGSRCTVSNGTQNFWKLKMTGTTKTTQDTRTA